VNDDVVSAPRDPWADPTTAPEPGYAGPPPTVRPQGPGAAGPYGTGTAPPYGYGPGPYGPPPPYGYPYGPPAYGPAYAGPPRPPGRPGQVTGAAVLTFVHAAIVLVASLYIWFFASVAGLAVEANPTTAPAVAHEFTRLGTTLSIVQLVSVVLLVTAGVLALTRRSSLAFLVLIAAHGVQLVLAAYWAVRLDDLLGPAAIDGVGGVLAVFALFFSALPLVALGLVLIGGGRRWFTVPQG
jgi:hypothetical protein